jgi:hypothetical protein
MPSTLWLARRGLHPRTTRIGLWGTAMSKHNVNLDALLKREDFEIQEDQQQPSRLTFDIKMSDLEASSLMYQVLRKPDFQRETASWDSEKVAEFVESFLEGALIPALILWRSPRSGNVFVIDGAHRLSALIAWIHDDYGDRVLSRQFFEGMIPKEQEDAAQKTRELLRKKIGSYAEIKAAAVASHTAAPEKVKWAKNMSTFAVSLQWVQGESDVAETSFFKINQKAAPIDPTELRMIEARHKPNALAARALMRAGVGHKYWSDFGPEQQEATKTIAKDTYDILFDPTLQTPIKTLDLPVAGRGYSAESVRLVFDFVNLANDIRSVAQQKKSLANDHQGDATILFLKKTRKIARRISGMHPSSLGLHPAVYFYAATGRYQPTAFLGAVALIQKMEKEDSFDRFTSLRRRFEEFLVTYRDFTNQIVRKYGSNLKSSHRVFDLYDTILSEIEAGGNDTEVAVRVQSFRQFQFLKQFVDAEQRPRTEFSADTKSAVFLRNAIESASRCGICQARLHVKSISFDHIIRVQDGGTGDEENAQMTHMYCNSTYKERPIALAKQRA